MRLAHRPRTMVRTERAQGQHGYVLVKFALLLVPLLLMSGLSIDVGYWYSRASDIQKAADAAALAGVVWLPNETAARQYALAAAAENGFSPSSTIDIQVEAVAGANRRLRVTIEDDTVGSFFWENLGGSTIDLSRGALAEYILPVPLGSPLNTFGGNTYSDPSVPAADQANLWGNIHGPRTDNRKGDAFAPACRGSDHCAGTSNGGYRPEGYLYAIDVPTGLSDFQVQVFDAGLYDRGSDESVETGDRRYTTTGTTTTTWTMYDMDFTLLDVRDNPKASTTGLCSTTGPGTWALAQGADSATYRSTWATICRRNGSIPAGRYYLRVETSGTGSAANRYALRVLSNGLPKARISAYGDMSMYNNVASGNAAFYLAEVGPEHRGKTLELNLYDPGEVTKTSTTTGDGEIQVLAPNGSITSTCGASSTNNILPNTLTPCKFQTAVGGNARFNGEWVTLQIPIPTSYSCVLGTLPGCWWKIRYVINGQGNDTTTWSAAVIGDPVHLVEEETA